MSISKLKLVYELNRALSDVTDVDSLPLNLDQFLSFSLSFDGKLQLNSRIDRLKIVDRADVLRIGKAAVRSLELLLRSFLSKKGHTDHRGPSGLRMPRPLRGSARRGLAPPAHATRFLQ